MGRTPRRWLSLSLRGSLVLVLLFGLWLGWQAHLARKQREAVAAVKEYGGFVRYDWELDGNGMPVPGGCRGPPVGYAVPSARITSRGWPWST